MKRFILVLVVAMVFVVSRDTAVAASAPEEGAGITVLGYGSASAPPDSVRIKLFVSEEPIYGPGGPVLKFVEMADLEEVRDVLVELGIEADAIEINPFSREYVYGPAASAGELVFTYSDVAGLRALLESLLDETEDRRGPNVSGVQFDFRVEDCKALETEAMQTAVADARDRAERLAGTFGMTVGRGHLSFRGCFAVGFRRCSGRMYCQAAHRFARRHRSAQWSRRRNQQRGEG